MITRAQAEALLTLAESLEACERLGLPMVAYTVQDSPVRFGGQVEVRTDCCAKLTSMCIRLAVNNLVPKHTGS